MQNDTLLAENETNSIQLRQLNAELTGKVVHLETLQQTLNDASAQNDGLETQLSNIRTTLIRTQEEYIEKTETLRVERDTLAAELVALQHNSKTELALVQKLRLEKDNLKTGDILESSETLADNEERSSNVKINDTKLFNFSSESCQTGLDLMRCAQKPAVVWKWSDVSIEKSARNWDEFGITGKYVNAKGRADPQSVETYKVLMGLGPQGSCSDLLEHGTLCSATSNGDIFLLPRFQGKGSVIGKNIGSQEQERLYQNLLIKHNELNYKLEKAPHDLMKEENKNPVHQNLKIEVKNLCMEGKEKQASLELQLLKAKSNVKHLEGIIETKNRKIEGIEVEIKSLSAKNIKLSHDVNSKDVCIEELKRMLENSKIFQTYLKDLMSVLRQEANQKDEKILELSKIVINLEAQQTFMESKNNLLEQRYHLIQNNKVALEQAGHQKTIFLQARQNTQSNKALEEDKCTLFTMQKAENRIMILTQEIDHFKKEIENKRETIHNGKTQISELKMSLDQQQQLATKLQLENFKLKSNINILQIKDAMHQHSMPVSENDGRLILNLSQQEDKTTACKANLKNSVEEIKLALVLAHSFLSNRIETSQSQIHSSVHIVLEPIQKLLESLLNHEFKYDKQMSQDKTNDLLRATKFTLIQENESLSSRLREEKRRDASPQYNVLEGIEPHSQDGIMPYYTHYEGLLLQVKQLTESIHSVKNKEVKVQDLSYTLDNKEMQETIESLSLKVALLTAELDSQTLCISHLKTQVRLYSKLVNQYKTQAQYAQSQSIGLKETKSFLLKADNVNAEIFVDPVPTEKEIVLEHILMVKKQLQMFKKDVSIKYNSNQLKLDTLCNKLESFYDQHYFCDLSMTSEQRVKLLKNNLKGTLKLMSQ
ncbi:hypothetical protein BC830DRAFT_1097925 [Chytriomyces sp. MP71]|nr:hypothetical protein BC830DRAFT_1097925 [Chytriomyces sp. MP71]